MSAGDDIGGGLEGIAEALSSDLGNSIALPLDNIAEALAGLNRSNGALSIMQAIEHHTQAVHRLADAAHRIADALGAE